MGMDGAGGQNHRHRETPLRDRFIGQDDMGVAAAHGVLGVAADPLQSVRQILFGLPAGDREGAVDDRRRGPHVVAHGLEFGVGQDRRFEQQMLTLFLAFVQNIAEVAEAGAQGHDPPLA